jgi:hypothetical protein
MSDPPKFLFIHVVKSGGTSLVFHLLRDPVDRTVSLPKHNAFDLELYEYAEEIAQ